ncbi:redox-sensitive transcriptional activator SoxR [Microlunatus elymi]|uniref:Redox-sensitive transcriptional activator SoxR n=1 Tax=Microlunatus elymi TaxID=2596828 RepID=A0A516PZT9_9ACTN|nr:redox-sensitive transcriptional activator SoxR [Microlunatus elymi]QDP96699.1 redox-sensitive transcriptional activator SoxR [Microlunatus elymi]
MQTTDFLTIGDISARSGVAPSAIRFYETHGLINSERTAGNQRRFRRSTLRRLAFIRTAQRVGLSLEEISAALATLPEGRTPTRTDWAQLSQNWRPRIDEQIQRLEALRDKLDSCIGCGCLSLSRCALQNPDDEAGRTGTGARYLEPAAAGE